MSQGFATVVLDVPIDAWADVSTRVRGHARGRPRDARRGGVVDGLPGRPRGAGRAGAHPRTRRRSGWSPGCARSSSGGRPASCASASAQRLAELHISSRPAADAGGSGGAGRRAGQQLSARRALPAAPRPRLNRADPAPPPARRGAASGTRSASSQRAHRHLGVDRHGQHAEQLAAVRADDGGADQHPAVGVLDDLDEPVVARPVDPAARLFDAICCVPTRTLRPASAGLLLGQPDATRPPGR